jgi:hypothetical protein
MPEKVSPASAFLPVVHFFSPASVLRHQGQTTHLRKFSPNLKIMDKDMDLALYRDLYRSLTITISRDRFNEKKTSRPIPRLFQRSKVVSRNRILPFLLRYTMSPTSRVEGRDRGRR